MRRRRRGQKRAASRGAHTACHAVCAPRFGPRFRLRPGSGMYPHRSSAASGRNASPSEKHQKRVVRTCWRHESSFYDDAGRARCPSRSPLRAGQTALHAWRVVEATRRRLTALTVPSRPCTHMHAGRQGMNRVRTHSNRLAMARASAPVLQRVLPCSHAPVIPWLWRRQCQLGGRAPWPKDAETRPALFRLASSSHERNATSTWQVAVAMRSHRRIRSMTTLQAVRCVLRCHA